MKYYVYELIDPRNNKPFYVGKGNKLRMYKHAKEVKRGSIPNGNQKLFNKINKILSLKLKVQYKKLFENIINEEIAYKKEIKRIAEIGIENLCNLTYGGDGVRATKEIKKKMSNSHIGQVAWNKGIPRTEEEKKNISESLKGQVPWNKGKRKYRTNGLIKKCKKCKKYQVYKTRNSLEHAIRKKTSCRSCANSGSNNPNFRKEK